jgi:hypothetical protein
MEGLALGPPVEPPPAKAVSGSAASRSNSERVTPPEKQEYLRVFVEKFVGNHPEAYDLLYMCKDGWESTASKSNSLGSTASQPPLVHPTKRHGRSEPVARVTNLKCPKRFHVVNTKAASKLLFFIVKSLTPNIVYNEMASTIYTELIKDGKEADYYKIRELVEKMHPLKDFNPARLKSARDALYHIMDVMGDARKEFDDMKEAIEDEKRAAEAASEAKAAAIEAGDIPPKMRSLIASIQAKIKADADKAYDRRTSRSRSPDKVRKPEAGAGAGTAFGGRRRKTRAKKPRVKKTVKRRRNSLLRRR